MVTVLIRMQPIVSSREILLLLVMHREKSAESMGIYHRNGPEVRCFLDRLDVGIYILPASILMAFIRLDITVTKLCESSMYRSQKDYLLGRIHPFEFIQHEVDPSPVCILVHKRNATHSFHDLSVRIHVDLFLCKPLADRNAGIIVIGSDKDHDGIEIITMLILKSVCLTCYLMPLMTALAIYKRLYIKPLLKKAPIMDILLEYAWICYRIT